MGKYELDKNENHVLLFSGGLDSYLMLLSFLDNGIRPKLVYSEHGSKNSKTQLTWARRLARLHGFKLIEDKTLQLKDFEAPDAFIPNRNGFLAMVGALYGERIWMAIMDGEQTYSDCKQSTFGALSMALTLLSEKPIVVDSLFWELTKAEVISNLTEESKKMLLLSYSCHNGGEKHCGNCTACFRRAVSFIVNGLKEEFKVNPFSTVLAEEYYDKAKMGHYGKRDEEILEAFRKADEVYG